MVYYLWENKEPTSKRLQLRCICKLNLLSTVHNERTVTHTSPQFISAVGIRTDSHSSSSKCKTLVKSFSSTVPSPLRSLVVKVSFNNQTWSVTTRTLLLGQHALILAGLRDCHPGWNHCHLCEIWLNSTGLLCSFVVLIGENSSFSLHQKILKMRWSSPQQISRGHLW